MSSLLVRVRNLLRDDRRGDALHADREAGFRLHAEQRAEDLLGAGRGLHVAENAAVRASRRDHDLWRDGLGTITDLSAVEVDERSIAVGAGAGQPETVANVTASTFALTRVPALMGRTLSDADGLDGAADAVGRVIRIGGTPVTIVGVMPRGYGFPQQSDVW
jgi:hypothetical protein